MPVSASNEVIAEILNHYRAGHSINATAKILGVSPGCVCNHLKQNNLVGMRPRRLSSQKIQQLVDLYQSGLSAAECARRLGCKSATVVKYVAESGLTPRTHAESMQGSGNPAWRGGRIIDKDGYIGVWKPEHPYASCGGYVRAHRLVMERHLGRYLTPSEVVHHKDRNKQNNKLTNLELFATNAEHLASELKGKTPKWTEDGIRRMRAGHLGPGVPRGTRRRPRTDDQQ